jgi:hypothetical protein
VNCFTTAAGRDEATRISISPTVSFRRRIAAGDLQLRDGGTRLQMRDEWVDVRVGVSETPSPAVSAQVRQPLQDLLLDHALDTRQLPQLASLAAVSRASNVVMPSVS